MKAKLLHLMKNDDQSAAISAVLLSGLLPDAVTEEWLSRIVHKALAPLLSFSSVPEWEAWALLWLSAEDRTESSARAAAAIASTSMQSLATKAAAGVARAAACAAARQAVETSNIICAVATWTARWQYGDNPSVSIQTSQDLTSKAKAAELEYQHQTLFSLINEM